MEYPPAWCQPAGCRLMEQSDGNPRNFMELSPLNDPFPTTVQTLIPISQGGPEGHLPLYLRLPAHDNNLQIWPIFSGLMDRGGTWWGTCNPDWISAPHLGSIKKFIVPPLEHETFGSLWQKRLLLDRIIIRGERGKVGWLELFGGSWRAALAMNETNFEPLQSNAKVVISRFRLNMKI